ncbi:LysR substrate-binding domain-containing protein [Sphingopyxis sp. JAI128]|uniref:LysR substrate-binding domain-containing protein n=1 Tax=Sphingopyxis sp. JAI128 TaxID=2723066 RepID=UPI0016138409|nr:LysR substrate-binding domain-containing protein [Sphingopyxis sp. JAI128]MBB6428080.1 LysR family glycine cleavage system transcriptional activator [Sphingopyxis sp. JAI128]
MNRRLPPLSALRAFEAAARHGSFKEAAVELAVTPTAVSHQIRALEAHIDLALFERRTRQVVLTDAGARLYPVLRDGFDAFAEAIERLTRRRGRRYVTISATIAFTARWLVPRVNAFRVLHPDIDLQLQASDQLVDLERAGVDIAIRYGAGPYPDFSVMPLFADRFAPVFNPMLRIAAVADWPRIDFEWRRRHPDNPTWSRWFAEAGLPEPAEPAQLRFSDESHAIQAAVAGQGVALVSLALVEAELAAGQLVQPFGPTISAFRHHLLVRKGEVSAEINAVRDWLLAEASQANGGG